ncbi:MAG: hypothetical protein R3E31_29535 [Chloroflexota bacterium]|nr:hypothetical protein [Ardenticatenaceae bacterium]MCB8989150.1 hypothetical protein [Ardenticatenaceae bacterium]
MKREYRELWVILGLLALVLPVLFFSSLTFASFNGNLPDRPPTATPVASPVPGEEPTATPIPQVVQENVHVAGGFIHLQVDGGKTNMWTEVQWLAGDGNWYTVDGWRGNVLPDNSVVWYVGTDQIGATAWFRWNLFDYEGGQLLATSDAFKLPGATMQTITVPLAVR